MPLYHASVEMSFITHAAPKILPHIFAYNGLPRGAVALRLTLL